jgi:hypothetical protein
MLRGGGAARALVFFVAAPALGCSFLGLKSDPPAPAPMPSPPLVTLCGSKGGYVARPGQATSLSFAVARAVAAGLGPSGVYSTRGGCLVTARLFANAKGELVISDAATPDVAEDLREVLRQIATSSP